MRGRGWPPARLAERRGCGPGRATLPRAVASTGPAITGQPGRVGGELAEQLVLRPAADDVDHVDRRARQVGGRLDGAGVGGGERVEDAAHGLGRESAARARPPSAIRSGMPPGGMKAGRRRRSSGRRPGSAAAAASEVVEVVPRAHARRHSWRSQSPPTLRRNRVRPSTPPSLVKLAARAASVITGRVELEPDERPGAAGDVGERSVVAGTPTTAEAVSCDPTVVDRRRAVRSVGAAARVARRLDRRQQVGAGCRAGRAASVGPLAGVRTSSRPVVDAFV